MVTADRHRARWSRRSWLQVQAGLAVGATACNLAPPQSVAEVPVRLVGQDPTRAHRLHGLVKEAPSPTTYRRVGTLIVGAGAAGAAAAWWLARHGDNDFAILELEQESGGTARAGSLPRSAYPMGAHYLPAPPRECETLIAFLREANLVQASASDHELIFDPLAICSAPIERHLWRGYWHDGLYPAAGQSADESAQWQRWQDHLAALDRQHDCNGQRLFRLPLHRSAPAVYALDQLSAQAYLQQHGFTSWRLHWLVDYACRDDYGLRARDCSALAMLHHFLARGLEDRPAAYILTGAQGNAPLVAALLKPAHEQLVSEHLVFAVDPATNQVRSFDFRHQTVTHWDAQAIVWAAPSHVLRYLARLPDQTIPVHHTPWLVAGVQVRQIPAAAGAPPAWDNVAIDEDHLGYVVANHGLSRADRDPAKVLVYYEPLLASDHAQLQNHRQWLLRSDAAVLGQNVRQALRRMHPAIDQEIQAIDLVRWGHAMVRPEPGLLSHVEAMRRPWPNFELCGTDATGLPLFEQAFYSGVLAASRVLHARSIRDDAIA